MSIVEEKKKIDNQNEMGCSKEIKRHQMLYPNERVVAFLARNYPNFNENRDKRTVDIGFGSGRHFKLLMDYEFDTYGFDYSEDCVEIASNILGNNERLKGLKKADLRDKPYENEFFDVIICYGTIFYRKIDEMLEDLKLVNSMMKKGGKMINNFRTKDDHLYGKGKKIDDNTYILDKLTGAYKDISYTFLTSQEAEELLNKAGFSIESKERSDLWKNNLSEKHTWWIFSVRKEK
ncbi:class I SAM-dependent methyltransferase [Oceanirhabdus sp. W0125-5]|uniref:class I SAM-dependent methyltransferase n=1 Tax=Oceanirhabdus sp. W0125-5 TaxID=2999116 RepID=UPI0022F317BE|nr:class I SAM-dependent methyltransferase [Oceanirhabdus sp. W0125-5]WBW95457.1 class I SAM-dependent methyltransferase [Oceanirhabdus sp. W0125-5]